MFTPPHPPPSDAASSPLLSSSLTDNLIPQPPRPLHGAARLIRRASCRSMRLREPSVRVRESAAEQLVQRQLDCAYAKSIVVLDLLWNVVLLGIGLAVLWFSYDESPEVPLRVWIGGYMLQCVVHVFCVGLVEEARRRLWESSSGSRSESEDYGILEQSSVTSFANNLECENIIFSVIWWILGFYWVTVGGESLTTDSPQLCWITKFFLALGVICVLIWVAIASLIGIAVFFVLPSIIAILYVLTDGEGATKEEIDHLPKYKFRKISDFEEVNGEKSKSPIEE